ncbi:hypothetical protein EW146_g8017 [Bondarzewia mesenterica]|uniref:Uncharacterized protein n=1 Tax=Bondarzewia mesenterica TaxID=1095465 RepID=A0A4S4LIA5_9AGAM|nr:hypothetical protein EW146_g8017 [Bondarzewia mesenterica]
MFLLGGSLDERVHAGKVDIRAPRCASSIAGSGGSCAGPTRALVKDVHERIASGASWLYTVAEEKSQNFQVPSMRHIRERESLVMRMECNDTWSPNQPEAMGSFSHIDVFFVLGPHPLTLIMPWDRVECESIQLVGSPADAPESSQLDAPWVVKAPDTIINSLLPSLVISIHTAQCLYLGSAVDHVQSLDITATEQSIGLPEA